LRPNIAKSGQRLRASFGLNLVDSVRAINAVALAAHDHDFL